MTPLNGEVVNSLFFNAVCQNLIAESFSMIRFISTGVQPAWSLVNMVNSVEYFADGDLQNSKSLAVYLCIQYRF